MKDNKKQNEMVKEEAYRAGVELKNLMMAGKEGKQVSEVYRSKVSGLINFVSTEEEFLKAILKIYIRYNRPVPKILITYTDDEERFSVISRAFLLGLLS